MEAIKFTPDSPFTRKILVQLCISWIEENDFEYYSTHNCLEIEDTLNQLFSILLELFDAYKFPRHMFVPMVMYANKFVTKYGIKHNQLFNLLLTSTLITMKFWDDTTPITNQRIADAFRYTLQEVRIMEMRFLKGLDYMFSLTAEDIRMFIFETAKIDLMSKKDVPNMMKEQCHPVQHAHATAGVARV